MVDSFGWIEYIAGGPLAAKYSHYIEGTPPTSLVTPTIVVYEVYRKLKRERGEELALEAQAYLTETRLATLDDNLALKAADLSLERGLAMADAIIYATARAYESRLITSDRHFEGLPGVEII